MNPACVLAAIAVGLCGCSRESSSPRPTDSSESSKPAAVAPSSGAAPAGAPWLVEITKELGLPAEFGEMPDGTYQLPEIMGPGVALFDYDDDGDLDLLERRCPPPGRPHEPAPDRLWRREANGRYVDVSAQSGLHDPGFGQGVAIGDVDNDGDQDVYCANLFHDAFYLNDGDGTFTEATKSAGFEGAEGWNCAAAFLDPDRDGDLDLFVVHYCQYEPTTVCRNANSAQEFCGPKSYTPVVSTYWRNDGTGHFTDESTLSGLHTRGAGLGIACGDFTGDGWIDAYVADDASDNLLWVNRGDGTFVEEGLERGVALNRYGKPEGSMGIAMGDVDGDGTLDLMVTNIVGENNTLYCGDASHAFTDVTPRAGMSRYDLPFTGFGIGFFDVELDGDLDVAVVNGRVRRGPQRPSADLTPFWNLYAEENFLFLNRGDASFEAAAAQGGDLTRRAELTRALAFGDLDSDGDLDVVTTQVLGPMRVYRNDAPRAGHWLLVRARTGRRDALGADVKVVCGARTFRAVCAPATSYVTSHDPRVHFGLGRNGKYERIEVLWPSGRREQFPGGAADRVVELVEGEGKAQ